MPSTIHFALHNNFSQDVIVSVFDLFGGGQRSAFNGPLNRDESAEVEVFADSGRTWRRIVDCTERADE
jgi:hypothetical protein